MKRKGKFPKFLKVVASFAIVITAVFCLIRRLPECFGSQNSAALAAAVFTLADGEYRLSDNKEETVATESDTSSVTPSAGKKTNEESYKPIDKSNRDKSDYYDSFADHTGEEKYSIAEKTIGADGTQVENCFVKNKTGLDFDFESILKTPLTFKVKENSDSPQVLIYHTHTSEGYMDEDVDYFYDSFYSRTQNEDFNVVAVGNVIADTLNKKGIKTLHDKTVHDSTYNGSYDRSVQTVQSDMSEYSDIKVVLDIHRDALGTDDCKVKTVFTYDDKKAAQIMVLSGCDIYNERGFENWQNNLNFALKIQNTAETMYPGMTRPMSFDFFAYNEYVCDGSLLIEIGTDANSIDEVEYTAQLLANVLYNVLGE